MSKRVKQRYIVDFDEARLGAEQSYKDAVARAVRKGRYRPHASTELSTQKARPQPATLLVAS